MLQGLVIMTGRYQLKIERIPVICQLDLHVLKRDI